MVSRPLPILWYRKTGSSEAGGMRKALSFWGTHKRARGFIVAQAQGSLGDAAGYVALLLLAYERMGSAWAATALALADFGPAMLIGPALGALIDRRGALRCAIASDVIRAVAFVGLIFVSGVMPMLCLAVLAGVGSALFRPAAGALVPALAADEDLPAANALREMVRDGGQLLGPALAAGLLLVVSPAAVLGFNAATFVVSALLLARLRVRPVARAQAAASTPRGNVRSVLRDARARTLIVSSAAAALCGGMLNVAELALSQRDLASGGSGLAVLLGAGGVGLVAGSGLGGQGRDALGLGVLAVGMLGAAVAPALVFAVPAFALIGAGNGIFFVSNRLMLQRSVPEHLHGRAFGLLSSGDSWALGCAVVLGGGLVSLIGARGTFTVAGAAMLVVGLVVALREINPMGDVQAQRTGLTMWA